MASRGKPPTPEGLRASFDTANEKLMKFLDYHLGIVEETQEIITSHADDLDALKTAFHEMQEAVAAQGITINRLIEESNSDAEPVGTTTGKAKSKKKAAKKKGAKKKAAAKKAVKEEEPPADTPDDTPDPDEFDDIFGGDDDEDFDLIEWAKGWLGEKGDKKAKAKHMIVKSVLKEHEVGTLMLVDEDEATGFRDRVLALYEESE